MSDEIKITGEFTPDPSVCKFVVDRPLVESWSLLFKSREESLGSPLVDALFDVEGIAAVRVAGSAVTLTKNGATPWPELAPDIGRAIRGVLQTGQAPVSEAALEVVKSQPVEDIESGVSELFERHINPALASHGGFVRLVRVEDRDVHVEMGGGCQGCAASQATLRYGIESAIREAVPQVRNVVDVTDHAAGENPYYA
jgi:Fe-S cluster biogenesis protein NfuA